MRWASLLRRLGHRVAVLTDYDSQRCDTLVALHAVKSAAAVRRFKQFHPGRPAAVALTGTDVFADPATVAVARRTIALADRVIALQADMANAVPPGCRHKVRVIYQSAETPAGLPRPRAGVFEVCVLGHLRYVKDPFLAAAAARLLPPDSTVRVVHVGGALTPDMADRARAEEAANPRYRWLGERPRGEAVRILARCRLQAMTSKAEGGPSAVSEALACRVPVVSTRTSGVVGLLGADYPGLIDVGDVRALAELIRRCETDPTFLRRLAAWCGRKRRLVAPAREAKAWAALLRELL